MPVLPRSAAPETPLVRLVDDNDALRESVSFMLACEGYEVAAYPSGEALLRGDSPSRPGCIVLDVLMPGLSGLELLDELNRRGYELPIVFLTAHGTIDMAVYAMREGAFDFQQKPLKPESFLQSIAKAIERDRAKRSGARSEKEELRAYRGLSEREEEIARLVAAGFVNRTIAEKLGISPRTAEHYRAAAMQKLGLKSAAELAGFFERIDAAIASGKAPRA